VVADKLKELLVRAESWPEEAQDELVRSAFDIERRYRVTYQLSDEDRAALARSLEDMRANRFAGEHAAGELFARFSGPLPRP
jgi:type VI protein secretion system component VasK